MINSPIRKPKQSSLSDYIRKVQNQQQHPSSHISNPSHIHYSSNIEYQSNIQKPTYSLQKSQKISMTPTKQKFVGKIDSPLQNSRNYHPLIQTQQSHIQLYNPNTQYKPSQYKPSQYYKTLDIQSNMKDKNYDNLFAQQKTNNQQPSNKQKTYLTKNDVQNQKLFNNQNLFNKNLYPTSQFNKFYQLQPQSSDMITKKLQNSYSDLDYNLSVQPQQIKIPQVKRYQNFVNQFKLNSQNSKLQANFNITPQTSVIKSPQKTNNIQTNQFTPIHNQIQNSEPPTSQIIQRLRLYTEPIQSTNKKQQNSPNKKSQSLDHHFQFNHQLSQSPSQVKYMNKIPPLNKSNDSPSKFNNSANKNKQSPVKQNKRSPSILQDSPQKSDKKGQNQDILSSDDQDANELLSKIRNLQNQVTQLKTHKYEFAINKYRQQMKYQLQKNLQLSIKEINKKYDLKQQQIRKQQQMQMSQYNKSIQDIMKYKKTYAIILNQLKQNKQKIDLEYKQKIQQVKKYKQRLIQDWKRQSNEQIKKIINNTHHKHTIQLSKQKDKLMNKSDGLKGLSKQKSKI